MALIRSPFEAVVYSQTEVDEREGRGSGCLLMDKSKVSKVKVSKLIYENLWERRLATKLGAEHVFTSFLPATAGVAIGNPTNHKHS